MAGHLNQWDWSWALPILSPRLPSKEKNCRHNQRIATVISWSGGEGFVQPSKPMGLVMGSPYSPCWSSKENNSQHNQRIATAIPWSGGEEFHT